MIYSIVRRFLFMMNPETAHNFSFFFLRLLFKIPGLAAFSKNYFNNNTKDTSIEVFGIKFKNRIGLAAGFDKDAKLFRELDCLGFGFIEIGTVTPKPQVGNDCPRLFRLNKDKALLNRMGFNNEGVLAAAQRLKTKHKDLIVGGNIGKNKSTPNTQAVDDYLYCFQVLYPVVDYFVVNVSSPNTPNLRELQEKEPLTILLQQLMQQNRKQYKPKPILLKIAPDLSESQLDDIIDIVKETNIAGVIATNTTINRDVLNFDKEKALALGAGGISGKPLRKSSTEVIRYLHQQSGNAFPIIGVGGIHNAQDAIEKIEAGASLVQLYTGFIYKGPSLIRNINKAISIHVANK